MTEDEKQRQIDEHAQALERGDAKFDSINERLDAVMEEQRETRALLEDIREVVGVYSNIRGFITVMKWIAWGAKWLAIVGGVGGALWYFVRTGNLPSKP